MDKMPTKACSILRWCTAAYFLSFAAVAAHVLDAKTGPDEFAMWSSWARDANQLLSVLASIGILVIVFTGIWISSSARRTMVRHAEAIVRIGFKIPSDRLTTTSVPALPATSFSRRLSAADRFGVIRPICDRFRVYPHRRVRFITKKTLAATHGIVNAKKKIVPV